MTIELVEILDTIMKELINEFKGIKEPMHTIIEEDEDAYPDSFLGSPLGGSFKEENDQSMNSQSEKSSLDISSTQRSLRSSSLMEEMPSPKDHYQLYIDPGLREGRVLFNFLRADIGKSLPIKSTTKADIYLDKVVFIGRRLVNIWFGKNIALEHYNLFIDLLKDKNYLISFPIMMESFRKLNYFQVQPSGFEPLCELILICLTEVSSP